MCFINEGRDINEVEQEAIKDVISFFFGWMDFFKWWWQSSFSMCWNPSVFLHSVRGSEAQGHFWQEACCWWICKVRFTDCRRDWKCQHKVNGRDSLTAHQSLEDIPKMFHTEFLDTIGTPSEIIIIYIFRVLWCFFSSKYECTKASSEHDRWNIVTL